VVVVGSAADVAVAEHAGTPGALVNVSSHQTGRPVRGALPHATAKAAIEGLTRALAVDYGPHGIRANAVALGSIATERYAACWQAGRLSRRRVRRRTSRDGIRWAGSAGRRRSRPER
jgi:NAD(P)-dependent dehydrogenase (short-subunit alcohol dehydrogenase family)